MVVTRQLRYVLLFVYASYISVAVLIRAPSIFRADEGDMHKYAAILAATEPFRVQCQEQVKSHLNPAGYLFQRVFGKTAMQQAEEIRNSNPAVDIALTRFEVRVQNTIR